MGTTRSVGQATTATTRLADGSFRMVSDVWLDSGDLLRETAMATQQNVRLAIASEFAIDPSGNLKGFRVVVRPVHETEALLTLTGEVQGRQIEVKARGPLPLMTWSRPFPYEPRGLVQTSLSPIDRMPGLQVGQRWRTRVVSPLTGRVEAVDAEVARRGVIQWGRNPTTVLEVVQKMPPWTARTWVRPDGLVLRQEVPFPFVKLLIERKPE